MIHHFYQVRFFHLSHVNIFFILYNLILIEDNEITNEFFQTSLYQTCEVTNEYYEKHKCILKSSGIYSPNSCTEIDVKNLTEADLKSWCYYAAINNELCPVRIKLSPLINDENYLSNINEKINTMSLLCEKSVELPSIIINTESPSLPPTSRPSFEPTFYRFDLYFLFF